ncbi:HK97 family phage prohead protease [Belliella sp. DSM 107340]|uniref:HK97 family phage prohead protease n=1 Tax=Belliella calami TaxID=2923436 RepID=A0ABS9UUL4_9BACT|nr:HK97 family phage prohead protease [Belliella calami]MCH7400119.1 HK97 family phage prohead protease [Belliella calami]
MAKQSYILNDETQANVYGFRVKNSGIDLDRFNKNPVMLAMHRDWDLMAVIGRWTNIRIEGSLLLADPEFDMEDEEAKKIAGKVERGFVKAVSMGFLFLKENLEKNIDDMFDLVSCELYESSFVTIPGNKNAVRLYAAPNKLMKDDEIRLCLNAVMVEKPTIDTNSKSNNMEKFTLSGAALTVLLMAGLTKQDDPSEINSVIGKLGTDLQTAKDDLATAKTTIQTMKDAQLSAVKKTAENLVDAAVLAGKLTADKREQFVTLAVNDLDLAKSILENMPGKKGLAATVTGSPAGGNADDPKNMDEFQALPLSKQLAFKADNPEGYAALFK